MNLEVYSYGVGNQLNSSTHLLLASHTPERRHHGEQGHCLSYFLPLFQPRARYAVEYSSVFVK